jgi:valyl-tRNA synthetase
MSKLSLNGTFGGDPKKSRQFLAELLEHILLLLHPVMPFVTEEIWQVLGEQRGSIMLQPYPRAEAAWMNEGAAQQMEFLMGAIRHQNLRTE